jgi:hypothetical protein
MSSNRVSLVSLFGAVLMLAACAAEEAAPLAPSDHPPAYTAWQGPSGRSWGDVRPALCTPLTPRVSGAIIGPSGGTLQIGPHVLTIPAGALSGDTWISGTTSGDSVNSVQFAPEGLHFAVPAVLSLSYANCSPPPFAKLKIVYTSDDLFVLLERILSVDLRSRRTVAGVISHFSRYAVAY